MVRAGTGLALLLLCQAAAWAGEGTSVARNWQARIETAPDGGMRLRVSGEAAVAGRAAASLSDDRLQGINPAILFLDLTIPRGSGAKRFRPVRFERTAKRLDITEVDIFLDNAIFARVVVRPGT